MDGRNMSEKSTDLEKFKRVLIVEEMILKGCSKSYIVRFGSENWKIGERQIEKYMSEAADIIKKDFEQAFDKEVFKTEIFGRFQDLYRKNYTIQDFRECRNILKDFRDLFGLDEAKETKSTNTNINHNSKELTKEEIKSISDKLDEQY